MKNKCSRILRFASRRLRAFAAILALGASLDARGLVITSNPSFTPAPGAPLAGMLQITTDVPSRVTVSVQDGVGAFSRNFYNYATSNSIPLLGFKPGRTNLITVTVTDQFRNTATPPVPLSFVTGPLPADFPNIVLITNQPAKMEPGYTLTRVVNNGNLAAYLTILDNLGEVVWYSTNYSVLDIRQLPDGDLFLPLATNFVEMSMLGQIVQTWSVPSGLNINPHDGVPTSHGSILYINDQYEIIVNFPLDTFDPNAPLGATDALYNHIIEISAADGTLLHDWSLLEMLQPDRFDYLTYSVGYADLEHANAVIEDPSDDSIIVSMRHQDAIVKFSRATGNIIWILGTPDNWAPEFQPYLLTPTGSPFQWQYGQHAPMLTVPPQGNH